MVRIPTVPEPDASGETKQLYDEIRAYFGLGVVPDIMKIVSTRPDFLRTMFDAYRAMFGGGHLPRQVKEIIATVVSKTNSCRY